MGKNIVIFSTFFPPHLGGVEYYSFGLAEQLSQIGYRVLVVTTTKEYIKSQKYDVEVLDSVDAIKDRFPVIIPTKNNKNIMNKLSKLDLCGAIIQTRFYPLSAIAVNFLNKYNIPFLLIDHGTGHFDFSNYIINKFGELYEHTITWYIKHKCRAFYGVSYASCKWLEHFNISPNGVLHNAINICDYEVVKDFEFPGLELNDRIIISFVGRLIPEKGVDKLIKAFEAVHLKNYKTILLIAGDGELYEKYKTETIESVVFLGRLSHEDVICLLHKSDIYCFPSDYPEGLPTTVLEAAASKTLIISSVAGGTRDLICNENYGAILHDNTVKDIADTIMYYISNDDERKRIIENAYDKVLSEFTWDVVCKKIIHELKSLG